MKWPEFDVQGFAASEASMVMFAKEHFSKFLAIFTVATLYIEAIIQLRPTVVRGQLKGHSKLIRALG
jgi:hypothetical protein